MDLNHYNPSNNRGYGYSLVGIDSFFNYAWTTQLKNIYSQTIRDEFLPITTASQQKPKKIKTDRSIDLHNNIFQNFLELENIKFFSRASDEGPAKAERFKRTIRSLLKTQAF